MKKEDLLDQIARSPLTKILTATVAAGALIALTLFGGIAILSTRENTQITFNEATVSFAGKEAKLKVEVADSFTKWQQGLMFRTTLEKDSGMLFIFPNEDELEFWMKDTYISLDIIFLDAELKIVTIHENTTPNQTEERYPASKPAQYVLETNAGWARSNGIKVGDQLTITR